MPITTCMGQYSTRHTSATAQVTQPQPLIPLLGPPPPKNTPSSPTEVGAHELFLGKYSNPWVSSTPSNYILPLLHPHFPPHTSL